MIPNEDDIDEGAANEPETADNDPVVDEDFTAVIVEYINPGTGLPRDVTVLTGYGDGSGDGPVKRIRSASATSDSEAYNFGVMHARNEGLLHESMDTAGTQNVASSEASGEAAIPAIIADGEAVPDRPNYKTANTQADASPEVAEIDLSHDRDAELAPEDRREVEDPAVARQANANADPLPGDEHSQVVQPTTQSGVLGGEGEAGSEDTEFGTAGTQSAATPEATAQPSQESAAASDAATGDLGAAADSEQASHDEGVAVHNDSEKTDDGDPEADAANKEREDAKDRPAADKLDNGDKAIGEGTAS